jgi:hypothetical protein
MTLTEDEAKTKWCPFARVHVCGNDRAQDIQPHNRVVFQKHEDASHNPPDARCIGSACMAWRGLKADDAGGYVGRGFCGLAGKP